ncbi:hypothetical protein B0A48_02039 [Cryoendolithus antarcticus]|uniref:Calcineurin-like phosphoesterase domain-containing protein n=1 Tax=Cryoendolithus antarcticus TaxID=1507870 RepID=A0A1V8TMH1_9PEZI|nr:hypothetical protein B0A48_02039 [Cryoendolithus antarcticus]
MATLQYMSDFHLERIDYRYEIIKAAPLLVLAVDIGCFCHYDRYCNFLSQQCDPSAFDTVLLIAGNHEFYGSSRDEGLEAAERFINEPCMNGKLHFLDRGRFDVPESNVTVLGCTSHSLIPPDYTRLTNDFQHIKGWRVRMHNSEHERDLDWLRGELSGLQKDGPERDIVIATHYAPMFDHVCHPKNEGNSLSDCFSSNSFAILQEEGLLFSVTHWVSGHTHWNVDFKRSGVRVVSNQLCSDAGNLTWWQRKRLYLPFRLAATLRP